MKRLLLLPFALCLSGCSSMTDSERQAWLNFGLRAGETLLVRATK